MPTCCHRRPASDARRSNAPNGYGWYDLAGNVREWCWDGYLSSCCASSPGSDPHGAAAGSYGMHPYRMWLEDRLD
ncbi:MAG: SUMF1/EgtB/PvdO family nonheme iron enzyme [Verrucomicrobia bacterium]|nr:SUMF1/EgtB/PvdO family nonheme iron enzyme [Verrucomicrobiota bacterium]